MLNYEEKYQVYYRIWGGTTRVVLWGDPEYAKRLAASTLIHDGAGFGVNEPLPLECISGHMMKNLLVC